MLVDVFLYAYCLSCESVATVSWLLWCSLPFGASVATVSWLLWCFSAFWCVRGDCFLAITVLLCLLVRPWSYFGSNRAPLGPLGHSGSFSWHPFCASLGLSWDSLFVPLLASPGTLLGLFGGFLCRRMCIARLTMLQKCSEANLDRLRTLFKQAK